MKTRVLILCTANSARSQMGEGILRDLAGEDMDVFSAGTTPSAVNPYAIRAMAEIGLDISHHRSKSLLEFIHESFDYVITVCDHAAENCPVFPGPARRHHWGFPDPAAAQGTDEEIMDSFRSVRDSIQSTFSEWLEAFANA